MSFADLLLFTTCCVSSSIFSMIKIASAEYSLKFQLLNYSNPYFRLNVGSQEYLCVYTFYTWSPKGTVYYKCRLNFIVLVMSQSADDPPYVFTSKLITLPVEGPLKGIIDFERANQYLECFRDLGCQAGEFGKPIELRFSAKPARIRILISHYGPLADAANRFVHSDQNFLIDQFDIDLRNETPFDELKQRYADDRWILGRVRNKTLMTALAYRYFLRCFTGFYGEACDMVQCGKMGFGYPADMLICKKRTNLSETSYLCIENSTQCTEHPLIKIVPFNATSAMLVNPSGLQQEQCVAYYGYKLATFVLSIILIVQTMIVCFGRMDRNNALL